MTNQSPSDGLTADAPLEDPTKDAFGYAAFAKHIAKALIGMKPADGFVISIHGPWGFGKTTLLNFVRYYLAQSPQDHRPIIIAFNPWWFSGSNDLVGHFFGQLNAEFNKWGERFRTLRNTVADFGNAVSETPVPYAGVAKVTNLFRSGHRSIQDLRHSVEKILREQDQRIVVIIDDIDRLSAEETRQLFRVIKAIANLPNITYVLAFDQTRVAEALNETHVGSGLAFLEKIVQAPFDLPLPEHSEIRKLFLEQLNGVIAGVPQERFDQVRWANVFFGGIDEFVDSPRAIVRMMNSLRLTFAATDGEVDPIDFIAIETLRVFAPILYEQLRWKKDLLAGHSDSQSGGKRKETEEKVEALFNLVSDENRPAARTILTRLFPKVQAVLGGSGYGAEWEAGWRKDLRIASPDVFPVYFRLHVAAGEFTDRAMKAAIDLMVSAESFADFLKELSTEREDDDTTRVRRFLDRLEDYTETDIPLDVIPSAIHALLLAGDDMLRSEPERMGFLDFGIDVQVARIAWRLIRRIPNDHRYEIIARPAPDGGVAILVDWADSVLAQHNPDRGEAIRSDPILTKDEAEMLRALALDRIRAAASDGTLDSVPQLPIILDRWRQWGVEGEMKAWLGQRLGDDRFVVSLIQQYVQHTISLGLSDKAARRTPRIDLKWVAYVIDVKELLPRAQEALRSQREPLAREALQLFVDTATGKLKDTD
jgi:predicted KAP-like P-loop ATPase